MSARVDLVRARAYITQHHLQGARRVRQEIMAAVRRLADAPYSGRPGRVEHTREAVVPHTPYIVAYSVVGDELAVLAVIHGAQNWPEQF